jgi:arabinosyltransferase C
VLKNDPVFQARAATDTFSPNFRTLFFGYFPLLVLGLTGLGVRGDAKQRAGLALTGLLIGGLFLAAPGHIEGYFLTPVAFGVAFVAAVAAVALLSGPSLARNLIVAWAVVGLVAVYFPGLFQRKLAMGLAVPWGLLGGIALADLVRIESKVIRTAAIGGLAAVCSLSSLLWLRRELLFIQANVSRTSVHGVFLTPSATAAIAALDREPGRRVVAAPPGVASPLFGQGMQESTSSATLSPIMPDLNPIASGLTGAYSIAGHWSETPRYNARRGELSSIFYSDAPVEARVQRLRDLGVTHVIAPNPAAFPALPLADFAPFGRVISEGDQFRLIALR